MSEPQIKYRVEMTGETLFAVIAPFEPKKAAYWGEQPVKTLFEATINEPDEVPNGIDEEMMPGDHRDLPDSRFIFGVKLDSGRFLIYDSEDRVVAEGHLKDFGVSKETVFDSSNGFQLDCPALIGLTSANETVTFDITTSGKIDRRELTLETSTVEGLGPFVSKLMYEGAELDEEQGSGLYNWQRVILYRPGSGPTSYTGHPG